MNTKKAFSFNDRFKSFVYAFNGLKLFFKTEHNAWLHSIAAIIAIALGIILKITLYDWCFVCIAIGLVLIAEVFNTAIELLTDMVSPNYNEMAKKVKDIAAGGVLLAAVVSLVIGSIVFFKYI